MIRILAHVVCRTLEVVVALGAIGAAFLIEQAVGG